MTIPNPITAVVDLLRSLPEVAEAVGSVSLYGESVPFIVGGEIEDQMVELMPRRMILVMSAGGRRRAMTTPLFHARIDIRSYGKDPGGAYDASELSLVVHEHLQSRGRTVVNRSLILSATLVGGPVPGREGGSGQPGWPFDLRTYEVLISEREL